MRSVSAKISVHDWTVPVSCHPHERSSSATSARSLDDTGVQASTATAKEGRGAVRVSEGSYRPPSSAPASVEVRPRAVLPCSRRPKHQATGPIPECAERMPHTCCHCITRDGGTASLLYRPRSQTRENTRSFSTPTVQFTSSFTRLYTRY